MNLPHNEDSERAILGTILLTPSVLAQAMSQLVSDDFYSTTYRRVYAAMIEMENNNVEISEIPLRDHLKLGGTAITFTEIIALKHGIPALNNISSYVHILKRESARRKLMKLGSSLTDQAEGNEDPAELATRTEEALSEIRKSLGFKAAGFRSFEEVDVDAGLVIENMRKGISNAIPTGFTTLDRATRGGNQPGDVWVVASLTGRGKSSWALGAARAQAMQGIPVGLVSREMSEFENYARVLSAASTVPMWRVKPGMYFDTYEALTEWRQITSTLPIHINTKTSNVFELRAQVKDLVKTKGVRSLFVDYLQLMSVTTEMKNTTRAQEVATISRVLKEIAMECEIAVFALAQFNRYAAHGERPEIHHLAESSGIEKDASVVLILDMPEQKDGESDRECQMRIAKHRNGPCLSLNYLYKGTILTFEEVA